MISILAVLTQRQALEAIYAANGGLLWAGASAWNTSAPECAWAGIICNRDGFVIDINLDGFGLVGKLPDVFASFPMLKSLYLNNQNLVSAIPASFCTLVHLQYLQANNAGLIGVVPTCLCNLANVMFVYMDDNLLTGAIPKCIGKLKFLKEAHFACNLLEGPIPAGLASLKYLIEFHADCNLAIDCTSDLATRPNFIFHCGITDCDSCDMKGPVVPEIPEEAVCAPVVHFPICRILE
ncbi:Cyst wall protein [Spironucleus salmonicida]|uniref:Cyst wall protein n=1 Tax=Spironucleus salmonicida TaxID=348837 RepID=V6LIE7_9EUKA|nr:Cyst wall protein [Spironucleus salmonicida]|eukprot:EST43486.1 Cyst wall protein [Spironucleus salmonicida]